MTIAIIESSDTSSAAEHPAPSFPAEESGLDELSVVGCAVGVGVAAGAGGIALVANPVLH
jgi:hypothetical protein